MVEHRLPKQSMANIDVNLGAQSSYGSQTLPRQAVIETSTRYLGYRKLVGDISDRLRKENALRLAYMYDLPAWYYEVGTTYDTAFSLRVLIALEGKGVFSPESLDGLMKALKDISREDCAKLVDEYLGSCELQSSLECTSLQESDLRRSKSSSENSRRLQARGNHYNSMNIPVDVIERDLTQPTLHQSHSIPSEIGVHECATTIGIRTSSMPPVHRSVSHQDFRLSIECIISNVESLVKQISTVSHETQRSITAQSTPNSSVNLPTCLRDALASAKLVISNLKLALASKNLGKPSSLPVTPGRVSPVIPSFNISDERNFSRSGSAGLVPLETNHELEQVNKKLFFEDVEAGGTSNFPSPPSGHCEVLHAPESENMHICRPSLVNTTANSHSSVRKTRGRREVKQFSRKGLLFWQIKVKKLQIWLTQSHSKVESEHFYDHYKRSFKAMLHPHGIGGDAGKYMTLSIDCLDEPPSKLPVTRIVVKLVDPNSTDSVIPTVEQSIERRGIRFFQQFLSHAQVQHFKSTDVIIITIAVVSENTEETDDDL